MTIAPELQFSLLTEPIIRYRRASDGQTVNASLPELFVALAVDEVRDYPALRPHQRHPWHAFLVQLAAITLHKAERTAVFETAQEWRDALLALTPDDPDGAAWCLVSPPNRPALLQAAVVGGSISEWKSEAYAADEIDMLVTSKNHDIKGSRAHRAQPEDWLFALLSLQTQEGFLGAGNYGISRMNGGFASKPGVGVAAVGLPGTRWARDIAALLARRDRTVEAHGFQEEGGLALVWLIPWDGLGSLSFAKLDPFYIEICRRIRLRSMDGKIMSVGAGSKTARIAAKELNGLTGDAWTPIDVEGGKALTITANGFNYKLVSELMFGGKYQPPTAHNLDQPVSGSSLIFITQGITRGQGKTEGYHERRVPISPKVRGLLMTNQKAQLERISGQRIAAIGEIRSLVRNALIVLFENGRIKDFRQASKAHEAKVGKFLAVIEVAEDARFFDDLNEEMEAEDPAAQRLQWLLGVVERAEVILKTAFDAGPRSGIQKYRAQSAALSRFHGGLRSDKFPIPDLVNYYRQQTIKRQEETSDNA
ncbi:type I-E CRISPR-associated protein Cse1/CasA [Rhodoferax sp.]|uniref:type I-E CRISPR-associated protein Cse1/CasA n=1 Tax=Rhodoferax sp. TaxID=50421 RepID=UPI002734520C|nr:type I-E CRISPR-associated protein Cse1/CasA [Rhodoferax sp.]MDP3191381.1 type I-E CRISPR-associated protein Cse1/CasA [Rhodoferax sp.]